MASVLVTGASKGIGMAIALELARAGHTVYATMRNPAGAPELSEIAATEGLPIHVSAMDVDSDASVTAGFDAITRANGPVDVLVNNAGVEARGAVEELSVADFRSVMETNFFGALRCIKAVLPEMRARRSGCIVTVTSMAGRVAVSPLSPYCASKHALEALCEALAQEVKAFGIRVAIVEPGIIDTAMPHRIGAPPANSPYPQTRRLAASFAAALEGATPPSAVGEKILKIIESGTWTLRHTVGDDAQPFLDRRASMSDEQWVDLNAAGDEA
jgi:NAD(P)-dependent dehydrogenase (short-subunit alcohol dehydrogenase family)